MITRTTLLILSLVILVSPVTAQSREWCYIITDNLQPIPMHFGSVNSANGITAFDRDGQQHAFEPDSYYALSFSQTRWSPSTAGSRELAGTLFIGLTDGQRIRASIQPSDDPETLVVERKDGIRASLPIDRIRYIARTVPEPAQQSTASDDTLVLTNGDILTGFLVEIGTTFTIETPTGNLVIPVDRIERATIQNPPVHTPGTYIHTTQGERLRVQSFAADSEHNLTLTPSDPMYAQQPTPLFSLDYGLLAVEYKRAESYITNPMLADPIRITPTGDRSWTRSPITEHGSWMGAERTTIELPAPVAVRWSVPHNATKFSAAVNADWRLWTDNESSLLAITADGSEHTLWSMRMKPETPMVDILVDLPTNTTAIELRVEPGEYGPIQDRVWLRSTLLFVEGSPQFQ
ncbi:MAG: hypothetical protein KC996_02970 [Phycisphaerales bacterium]|nr:hypothetical protein [Phycisphaerales bacterium]